jgi:perosamine synthetase
LLQTLKLPAGSEILCSAITIPDMIYIIKYHNLVPVPVDIHADTLSVDVEKLRDAITDVRCGRTDLRNPILRSHGHVLTPL